MIIQPVITINQYYFKTIQIIKTTTNQQTKIYAYREGKPKNNVLALIPDNKGKLNNNIPMNEISTNW
ncbi:hypothetical protein [Olivibacter sp. XZL3]|uniref:hypothetical protein n=1 Tax=Olivibacter sp. XZL3 TaxID=1735116 RepID=UPI001416F804|nr:hypothetical protein [Olivibacter sp. XZL3]